MPTITLAEALAEVQTIGRRLEKKQQLVSAYLLREQRYRDPIRSAGGTEAALARELEDIRALNERKVHLRRLIQQAYARTQVTFRDQTRSLADWLVWRREVSARQAGFLKALRTRINHARQAAHQYQARSIGLGADKPADVVVHINEQELANQLETLEELLGYLDGQLALKNATVTIDLPENVRQTILEELFDQLLPQTGPAPAPDPALQPPWSTSPELCRLARDPVKKIMAIKLYRELTGVGLLEAKNAVEAFFREGQ